MSYQVLALKYRPQTFQDVIGQEHVSTTLVNAIAADRVAHAILFAGPRGTGKTTIARILAKAMNCVQGPTATPCNQCKSCLSITSGNSADVFEIDGASNNSVDQIRDLRENVAYLPSSSLFKIYIIDEVHMLSTAAFNALLKTLEEPPSHVMFIFATTEIHKIPVTILSRCQRHDLGRIALPLITGHLKRLCTNEGYDLSDESIDIIASEADGSMRDGLSLLDRILSSSPDKNITHDTVLQNLGIIDKTIVFDISRAIINGDSETLIQLIDRVHSLGFDLKKFYGTIIRQFRNLAVTKLCTREDVFSDISDYDRKAMAAMVSTLSSQYLSQALTVLIKEEPLVKQFSHTRTALEMVLLKLAQIRPGVDIDELITRLDVLAKAIDSGDISGMPAVSEPGTARSGIAPQQPSQPAPDPGPPEPQAQMSASTPLPAAAIPEKRPMQEKPAARERHRTWEGCVNSIARTLPVIGAVLKRTELETITETEIQVSLTGSAFDFSRLESKIVEVEKLCSTYFNKPLKLTILKQEKPQSETGDKTPAQLKQEIMTHPFIADALTLFNGTVVDIQTT